MINILDLLEAFDKKHPEFAPICISYGTENMYRITSHQEAWQIYFPRTLLEDDPDLTLDTVIKGLEKVSANVKEMTETKVKKLLESGLN